MSVYIDPLTSWPKSKGWPYDTSCHMIADNVKELKLFAIACGLKEEWYQPKSFPHFDLTEGKRRLAMQRGAIEITFRELVAKMKEIRKKEGK